MFPIQPYTTKGLKDKAKEQICLPYFDYLISAINVGGKTILQSFGRHVHWGYWEHPCEWKGSSEDFAEAAEELSRQLCRAGEICDELSVLDAGCGFGGTLAYLNDNHFGMKLTGLNLDERQLKRARMLVKCKNNNAVSFVHGDACCLPFPDAVFDVVLAVECIFHFSSRERFFSEVYRVLKPGGMLALSDFLPRTILKPFVGFKWLGKVAVGFYGKCNFLYGVGDYSNLAKQTGFVIVTERDITVNTLPTYAYLKTLSRPVVMANRLYATMETLAAEWFSRSGLLKYIIFAFRKPS